MYPLLPTQTTGICPQQFMAHLSSLIHGIMYTLRPRKCWC